MKNKQFLFRVGIIWLLIVGINTVWALADPILSRPDELAQIYKTEAVVRGQLVGSPVNPKTDPETFYYRKKYPSLTPVIEGGDPDVYVKVPATLQNIDTNPLCYLQVSPYAPHCPIKFSNKKGLITVETYVGRYPPMYYLLIGWPTLITPGYAGIISARILSGAVNAIFLAFALGFSLLRKTIWPFLGVVLAIAPVVLYYSSSINPNGFEITTAIASYTMTSYLVNHENNEVKQGLLNLAVFIFGLSLSLMSLSRASSPIFFVCIILISLFYFNIGQIKRLLHLKGFILSLVIASICAVVTTIWDFVEHGLNELHEPFPRSVSELTILSKQTSMMSKVLNEMVAVFGLNNISIPEIFIILWAGIVYILFLIALRNNFFKRQLTLVVLAISPVLIPYAVAYFTGRNYGLIWQGRYSLPLVVGLPILVGHQLNDLFKNRNKQSSLINISVILISAFVAAVQTVSITEDERHYLVGSGSVIKVFTLNSALGLPASVEIFLGLVLSLLFFCILFRKAISSNPVRL